MRSKQNDYNLIKIDQMIKKVTKKKKYNSSRILFYKSAFDVYNIAKYAAFSCDELYYSSKFKPGLLVNKTKKPKLVFINGCFHMQDWWFLNEVFKLNIPIISLINSNLRPKDKDMNKTEIKWNHIVTIPLYVDDPQNINMMYAHTTAISNMIRLNKSRRV